MLRESQRYGPRLRRHHVVVDDAARTALCEAEQLAALVKHIGEEEIDRVGVAGDTGRQIQRTERGHRADLLALYGAQLRLLGRLVHEGTLPVPLPAAQREVVARNQIALNLRGIGELLAARGERRKRGAARYRVVVSVVSAAIVLGELRIEQGQSRLQREAVRDRPRQLVLHAGNPRRAGIGDARQAVGSEERELEVLPVLEEDCAVVAQVIVEPGSLPAKLVVLQVVRLVRRQITDTVDAAGAVALRVREVNETLGVEFVRQGDLRRGAGALGALVEAQARRALELDAEIAHPLFTQAAVEPERVVDAVAAIALERVVVLEVPQPCEQRQVRGDIERRLAERRVVAVDALLLGQPPGILPPGDPHRATRRRWGSRGIGARGTCEANDLVVLLDVVQLA